MFGDDEKIISKRRTQLLAIYWDVERTVFLEKRIKCDKLVS